MKACLFSQLLIADFLQAFTGSLLSSRLLKLLVEQTRLWCRWACEHPLVSRRTIKPFLFPRSFGPHRMKAMRQPNASFPADGSAFSFLRFFDLTKSRLMTSLLALLGSPDLRRKAITYGTLARSRALANCTLDKNVRVFERLSLVFQTLMRFCLTK